MFLVDIVQNILKLAKEKKITNQQLCKILETNPNKIYDWKIGKSKPSAEDISKLADCFDVSTDYLLGRTTNSSTNASKTNELIFPTNDRDSLNELQEFVSGLSEEQIKDLIDYIEFKKFQQEKNRKETK